METYFAVYYKSVIPVYRIKEGWIPVKDYRESKDDPYYMCGSRALYTIDVYDKDVYDKLNEAIENCKQKIEKDFIYNISRLIKDREQELERLKELK